MQCPQPENTAGIFRPLEHGLQEQHPKDEVFVGCCIQTLLAESVGGGIEVTFELSEREFGHELSQRLNGIFFPRFSRVVSCTPGALP